MGLKISFGAVPCPTCGAPMVYHDYASTGLFLADCKSCKREWEIKKDSLTGVCEIRPKRIS